MSSVDVFVLWIYFQNRCYAEISGGIGLYAPLYTLRCTGGLLIRSSLNLSRGLLCDC